MTHPILVQIATALVKDADFTAPPPPQQVIEVKSMFGDSVVMHPDGDMGDAFQDAALQLMAQEPDKTAREYPELFQWKDSLEKTRSFIKK